MSIASVALATEPAKKPVIADKPAAAKPAPSAAPAPARVANLPAPLKLSIGNVRKYMMPNQYRAAITPAEGDDIIVEGNREAPPLKSTQPKPTGLGAVGSMFTNPGSAWRLFLPDPNAAPPGPPDPVPSNKQWYNSP